MAGLNLCRLPCKLQMVAAGRCCSSSPITHLPTQPAPTLPPLSWLAVGLAARTTGRPATRRRLLEPVLASLTSQRRSLAGVTQRNVDRSLDLLMDAVFTPRFIRQGSRRDRGRRWGLGCRGSGEAAVLATLVAEVPGRAGWGQCASPLQHISSGTSWLSFGLARLAAVCRPCPAPRA